MLDLLEHRIQRLVHFKTGAHKDEAATLGQWSRFIEGDSRTITTFVQLGQNALENAIVLRVHPDLALVVTCRLLDQPAPSPRRTSPKARPSISFLAFSKRDFRSAFLLSRICLPAAPLNWMSFRLDLLFDGLHSELAEPIILLLLLSLSEPSGDWQYVFLADSMMRVASALASVRTA